MNFGSDLKNLYLEKKLQATKKFLSIIYILGPPLYLVFFLTDYLRFFELRYEFLSLRVGFCLLVLVAFFANRKTDSYLKNQLWQLVLTFYSSASITYMMMRTDGPSSIYFGGLNLVALIALMFATYQTSLFFVGLVMTYSPYFLLCFWYRENLNVIDFLIQSCFIAGAIIVIIITRSRKEAELMALLTTQSELINVVATREKTIAQKTEEATKLNQLSAQFSPQVVQAIKEGKINLQEGVHRSKICAIFIDIVNSTERVVSLDHNKVQIVLARFLDTTLSILLKYDLTIDKFHGDGVLAFSNDPVVRPDYIERVCMAAIEVRDFINFDQDFYLANWENELQIRVGISAGFASVGFYGGKKYFRSFTAIGSPLPYASRLTSIAEPNQILIDSEIAGLLISQKFLVTKIGEKNLKGFEQGKNIVYSLINTPETDVISAGSKLCPVHQDSVLYLDTDDNGLFVFKCRECGYIDGQTVLTEIELKKIG